MKSSAPARAALSLGTAAVAAVLAVILVGGALTAAFASEAAPDLFRISRAISAPAGWVRLSLPDDVLDACRPGLPDLRIFDASGHEVPWAFEERLGEVPVRYALSDVERVAGRETTAIVDRGRRPPLARWVELSIDGTDWLKPITAESSEDGASWTVFAKGSVFATRTLRSTVLRFPGNDRRWWRFRFDDRNGDPVTPRDATAGGGQSLPPAREIPLAVAPGEVERDGRTAATLPAANLGVTGLRVEGRAAAYARRVLVWERVFFRGEVLRRPIGEGILSRAPDGSGRDEISVCEPAGRALEIEVERMDGPPFEVARVVALARPRAILFSVPAGGNLRLAYGSAVADPPRYDLERALSISPPREPSVASLGAAVSASPSVSPAAAGTGAVAVTEADRGAEIDPARWKWRQPVALPPSGSVAYLDLAGVKGRSEGAPRLVDVANHQVPYVFEAACHAERHPVDIRVSQRGTKTVIDIPKLDAPEDVDSLEISATAPPFFSRGVNVLEQQFDARGEAGTRLLGSASWEKRAEEESAPLRIAIARPSSPAIRVEIENGDNAPVAIGAAAVWTCVPRIDFVFRPGDRLLLLSGASDAPPPRYDLELVASKVLASPALPAKLEGYARPAVPQRTKTPAWLWIAVAAAAALVALVLARTLKAI